MNLLRTTTRRQKYLEPLSIFHTTNTPVEMTRLCAWPQKYMQPHITERSGGLPRKSVHHIHPAPFTVQGRNFQTHESGWYSTTFATFAAHLGERRTLTWQPYAGGSIDRKVTGLSPGSYVRREIEVHHKVNPITKPKPGNREKRGEG